jgi:large subunit ribosomal protein L3
MKFILGKKVEMTQLYKEDGMVVPVTAVLALPNVVTQVKSADSKDGYNAVQVGFGVDKKPGKSRIGHLKDLPPVKTVREFRLTDKEVAGVKRGDVITVEVFAEGDAVTVTGQSKGKGFQGVVKRHGFHGQNSSHGHKDQERMPGSIGAGGVQRVFKGKRMAGHMGDEQVTVSGLQIIAVEPEKNILYVKGAVPGARHGLIMIYGPGEMIIKQPESVKEIPEEITKEVPVEKSAEDSITEIKADTEIKAEPREEVVAESKEEAVAELKPIEENKIEEVKE